MIRNLFIAIFMMGLVASLMTSCAARMNAARAEKGDGEAREMFVKYGGGGESAGRQSTGDDGSSVQIERSSDGHFYADVEINGTPVHMLVDTGATGVALSRDDARSAGIATSIGMNDVVGEGADGSVHGEYVTVDRMRLGNASAEGLEAVVLNNGAQSLLGQEFLAKFDSVEIHGDTMVLQ